MTNIEEKSSNFIWDFIDEDLANGRYESVHTRFPPEPNGYLHIGHCKAFCTNFGTAEKYNGLCNLRFDDTNPSKEETHFVDGIKNDIKWMGFDWNGGLYYASDYYEKYYEIALAWIKRDIAYVDELSADQAREYRGTLTQPGKNSPFRDRPIEENIKLFEEMRNGKHAEGSMILRAKIDMASPNLNMRDPALYRILYKEHHRTGNKWCIYPMYDFAHPLGDAFEGITHSLCSLEFEDHRPLYEWIIENALDFIQSKPRQIEFARLNLTQTVMSKRYLRTLVDEGLVTGWDDPRMPTICGMRRRGYTADAIKDFINRIGVSKADSTVDFALLEHCVREDLGDKAARVMAVLHPLEVEFTNWDEGRIDTLTIPNHPQHPEMGTRTVKFSKKIYIDTDDFMEVPVRKFFRMTPGKEVRLMGAYIVKCNGLEKDDNGNVTKLLCTVDLDSKSGSEGANRKVKGTLQWVGSIDSIKLEARLLEPMLNDDNEDSEVEEHTGKKDFISRFNKNSLSIADGLVESCIKDAKAGDTFQFMRIGYFCMDADSTDEKPVFNRVVGLRDTFKKNINK